MTVAIDISQIVFEGTGVAEYTKALVRAVVQEDPHNRYVLFGMSWRRKHLLDEFIHSLQQLFPHVSGKTYAIPEKIANRMWNSFHVVPVERLIGNVDIFHSSDWIQPPARAKKVTTIHDVISLKFPETSYPYIVETQKKRFHWVQKECDHVFADSLATKEDIVRLLSISGKNISVVYPGIDPVFSHHDDTRWPDVRQTYDLPGTYLLAVGTQEPRKNLHRLLEAYERLCADRAGGPVPELVIAGKYGWGKIMVQIPRVRGLGYVSAADLPLLYRHAAAFIFPSLYEGFGLPIVEAMASGCPVVTTDRGSLKEVAGDAVVMVNPEDVASIVAGIKKVLADGVMRNELIEKGLKQSHQFQWKKSAQEVIAVYNRIGNL